MRGCCEKSLSYSTKSTPRAKVASGVVVPQTSRVAFDTSTEVISSAVPGAQAPTTDNTSPVASTTSQNSPRMQESSASSVAAGGPGPAAGSEVVPAATTTPGGGPPLPPPTSTTAGGVPIAGPTKQASSSRKVPEGEGARTSKPSLHHLDSYGFECSVDDSKYEERFTTKRERRKNRFPATLPPRFSEELRALCRKGVPDDRRAEVWTHCLGSALKQKANSGVFQQLTELAQQQEEVAPEDSTENASGSRNAPDKTKNNDLVQEQAAEQESKIDSAATAVDGAGDPGGGRGSKNYDGTIAEGVSTPAGSPTTAAASQNPSASRGSVNPAASAEAAAEPKPTASSSSAVTAASTMSKKSSGLDPVVKNSIEVDLDRTFSRHSTLSQSKEKMRAVLQAFALRHPSIGYCQGLNYIVGRLLLFLEPEAAFWALDVICEGYYPFALPQEHKEWELKQAGYYIPGMRLLRADSMALRKLMKTRGIADEATWHIELDVAFQAPWFLTLFAGPQGLPSGSLYRFWDCLFAEGIKVLFRLSLILVRRAKLKRGDSLEVCHTKLKDAVNNACDHNELFKESFGLRRFSRNELHALRQKCYEEVAQTEIT
ncbi:unnamed protein product [Amoebophrya sp. A120]|nr:unnamed protein product [Amoebophrya sp. A120]|eukprot:GSA120T00006050001.1